MTARLLSLTPWVDSGLDYSRKVAKGRVTYLHTVSRLQEHHQSRAQLHSMTA